MASIASSLQDALSASPEYETATSELSALLVSYPPPFIYVHDQDNIRLTAATIRSTLTDLVSGSADILDLRCAFLDAVACFSPRILFDTALNALAGWTPRWDDGAQNWQGHPGADARRYNENIDAFIHGLQAISTGATATTSSTGVNGGGKGKARAQERQPAACRMVLIVERAERLKDNLPDLVVPLTRLAELVSDSYTCLGQQIPHIGTHYSHEPVPSRRHNSLHIRSAMAKHPPFPSRVSGTILHRRPVSRQAR